MSGRGGRGPGKGGKGAGRRPGKSGGGKRRGPGKRPAAGGGRRRPSDQRSAMPGDADERAALEGTGGRGARRAGGRPPGRGSGRRPPTRSANGNDNGQPELPRDVWRDESPTAPVVGVLRPRGRFLVAEPLFERGGRVNVERAGDARIGQLALLAPLRQGRRAKGHRVVKLLGSPDVARDVLEALLLDFGLPRRVARMVGVEAEGVAAAPYGEDEIVREDLRDLPTFTIDPVTAQDFDDAISAEQDPQHPERITVWVHIADVAAYVRPGGAIDADARWRGTSVYVPGTVEPMLPPTLSNDACSLVPHVDRLAVSVRMELDGSKVVKTRVVRSVIRSDARLEYDQVDRIFAGQERAEEPWATPLMVARRAAAARQERREDSTSALELNTGEPRFRFDGEGHVDGIVIERQTEAHRLIEHLMVAANEQVAKLLDEHSVPTLHRVHGLPTPTAARRLAEQLASVGVSTTDVLASLPEHATAEDAGAAIATLSRAVDAHVRRTGHGRSGLSYLVLRALQQARYDPRSLGHAGLGLAHYCHFTSPIRRYPDLIAHRAVLSLVGAGEEPPAGSPSRLEELGVWCSATEREAMQIERTADQITRAFLLERVLFEHGWDQRFAGEVTGVASGGAFVRFGGDTLDDEAFEGMLPARLLSGDWWELDERGTILHGTRTGKALRIGDPVSVRVDRVEPQRGRVTLTLAER
jgi:ribonuclease R